MTSRLKVFLYELRNPGLPWLTPTTNNMLATWLRQTDVGLEFGSGRSTLWFAKRVAGLISVEHDVAWFTRVSGELKKYRTRNVDYRFVPKDGRTEEEHRGQYLDVLDEIEDGSLDFALVDGMYRDFCAMGVTPKLKKGAILILDNANSYLPSQSLSVLSRSQVDGAGSAVWTEFATATKDWRYIWSTNGCWDTAIYLKPCDRP